MQENITKKVILSLLVVVSFITAGPFLKPISASVATYPELLDQIAHDGSEILIRHGMPVQHNRHNPWFQISGGPKSYTIFLYLADEIPRDAKKEMIQYVMELYEINNREKRFRIFMYYEPFEEEMKWWKGGIEPFFEFSIGGDNL